MKTVSRSAGRSATAAAAYRSGEEIADERTGEIHDYTRRTGVDRESSGIVLPDDAPEWARDRAALWNAAEAAEKRKNSTVAREFEIALPAELPASERAKLAHDFAREIATRHGCAVDVCIHEPGKEGDHRNHHAHLLLSTRRLDHDGFGEKTRELDDQKTGPGIVTEWRERFATMQNERLAAHGVAERVDHRSLEAQREAAAERGDVVTYALLDRLPQVKQGPKATAMQRRGEATERGQMAAAVAAENSERPARLAGELAKVIDLAAERERRAAAEAPRPRSPLDMMSIDLSVLDAPSAPTATAPSIDLSALDAPAPMPRTDPPATVPREPPPPPAGVDQAKPSRPSWEERKAAMEQQKAAEEAAILAAGQQAQQRQMERDRDANINAALRLIEGAAALRANRQPEWSNDGAAWKAMPAGMQTTVQRLTELNHESKAKVIEQLRKQATPEDAAKVRKQIETAYHAGREQQAQRRQQDRAKTTRGQSGPEL